MPRPSVNALCLFCGSRSGNDPAQSALAEDFGRFCAANKLALVYGGGGIGLMGLAARAAIVPNVAIWLTASLPYLSLT